MDRTVSKSTTAGKSKAQVNNSEFLKEKVLCSGKWVCLKDITYRDPNGVERSWEVAARTTRKPSAIADAVAVVPVLKRALKFDCLVCVKQYRPPMKAYCLEFPAGLIDDGETAREAAIREMKEETGYTITEISHTSAPTANNPGLESSTVVIVNAEIDGDLEVNQCPKPKPEETEFIEVVHIPVAEFLKHVDGMAAKGVVIDSRVYTYGLALQAVRKHSVQQIYREDSTTMLDK